MNEQGQDKIKYKRAGSLHNIRIRPGMRSGNTSPKKLENQLQIPADPHPESIQNIMKKIPRTIELQDNMLV